MRHKPLIWIGIFFMLIMNVYAICSVNETTNDTVNRFSVLDCEGSLYLVQNEPNSFMGLIILLPLLLGFLLMYWATNLGEDHNILKILIYLSPIPLFFISIKYAVITLDKFYVMDTLIGGLSDDVYIIGLIFFTIVVYFILYLIIKIINYIGQKNEEKLNY